jgi:hypothetical protein
MAGFVWVTLRHYKGRFIWRWEATGRRDGANAVERGRTLTRRGARRVSQRVAGQMRASG